MFIIYELAQLVAKETGFDGEIVKDTSKPDGTPRKLMDNSKLKELGWTPSISLEQGIRDTIAYYRHEVRGTL